MDDTSLNLPETLETLTLQQKQLILGYKASQMFPTGTEELDLPVGFKRLNVKRGVFHFNPALIDEELIEQCSSEHKENLLLGLGPYNKQDIYEKVKKGEKPLVVVEHTNDGVEVKAAVGVESTLAVQLEAFQEGKLPETMISVKPVAQVLLNRSIKG